MAVLEQTLEPAQPRKESVSSSQVAYPLVVQAREFSICKAEHMIIDGFILISGCEPGVSNPESLP